MYNIYKYGSWFSPHFDHKNTFSYTFQAGSVRTVEFECTCVHKDDYRIKKLTNEVTVNVSGKSYPF